MARQGNTIQHTESNVSLGMENVALDTSTKIGLQGDDLAVVAQLLGNQQVTSQTALLAANNQLSNIIKDSNTAKAQITSQLSKNIPKWIAYAVGGGILIFALTKYFKR